MKRMFSLTTSVPNLRRELLRLKTSTVISFDVFDTILFRRVAPERVVRSVAAYAETLATSQGCALIEPALAARDRAYTKLAEAGAEAGLDFDCRLDELAPLWFSTMTGQPVAECQKAGQQLLKREFDLEAEATYLNVPMAELLRELKAIGRRLIYISDMYLGQRLVEDLLIRAGCPGVFSRGFVSGDQRLLKRTGRLFSHVLATEGIDAASLAHVGDCKVADGEQAAKQGIRAFVHSPRATRRRRAALKYDDRLLERNESWAGEMSAAFAFSQSPEKLSTPEELGWRSFGPLYAHWVHALAERCRELGVRRVFFAAREGFALQELFDTIAPEVYSSGPVPESNYLPISRLTTFRAAARNIGPRELTCALANTGHVSVRTLLNPFRLPVGLIERVARRHGVADVDQGLPEFFQQWPPLHRVFADVELLAAVAQGQKEASEYLERLLEQHGFFGGGRIAFIDVGWSGQIQDHIYEAFSSRPDFPEVTGLYMGTRLQAAWRVNGKNRLEGLLEDETNPTWQGSALFEFVQLFEAIPRAPHGTVVGYRGDKVVEPVFKLDNAVSRRREMDDEPTLALVQDGIFGFARAYAKAIRLIGFNAAATRPYAMTELDRLIRHPTALEAELLLALRNVSDMGSDEVFTLGGKLRRDGSLSGLARGLRGSFWRPGTIAAWRLPLAQHLLAAYDGVRSRPPADRPMAFWLPLSDEVTAPSSGLQSPMAPDITKGDVLRQDMMLRHRELVAQGRAARSKENKVLNTLSWLDVAGANASMRLTNFLSKRVGRHDYRSVGLSAQLLMRRSLNANVEAVLEWLRIQAKRRSHDGV